MFCLKKLVSSDDAAGYGDKGVYALNGEPSILYAKLLEKTGSQNIAMKYYAYTFSDVGKKLDIKKDSNDEFDFAQFEQRFDKIKLREQTAISGLPVIEGVSQRESDAIVQKIIEENPNDYENAVVDMYLRQVTKDASQKFDSLVGHGVHQRKWNMRDFLNNRTALLNTILREKGSLTHGLRFMKKREKDSARLRISFLDSIAAKIKVQDIKGFTSDDILERREAMALFFGTLHKFSDGSVHDLSVLKESLDFMSQFFNINPNSKTDLFEGNDLYSSVNSNLQLTTGEAELIEYIRGELYSLSSKYDSKINKAILSLMNSDPSVIRTIGSQDKLSDLLRSQPDINWLDQMIMNSEHNIVSKDSVYPQVINSILRREINAQFAITRAIQNKLDKSTPAAMKKLKSKSNIFGKSSNFSVFRSKDKNGDDTNRMISKYSVAWYHFLDDIVGMQSSKSVREINEEIKKHAQILDYRLLNLDLQDIPSSLRSDFEGVSQDRKDSYEADLINRFGEKELERLKAEASRKLYELTSFRRASNGYLPASLDPLNYDKNTSSLDFNILIPNRSSTVIYVDPNFEAIENDPDLYEYWKDLEEAVNYINFAFSDATSSMNYNEIPSMAAQFMEEVVSNGNIKGAITLIRDSTRKIYASSFKDEKRAYDSDDLNKVYHPKVNDMAKAESIYMHTFYDHKRKQKKNVVFGNLYFGNNINLDNILSKEFLNFLGDVYNVRKGKKQVKASDLHQFAHALKGEGNGLFLDVRSAIDLKASKIAQANQSSDLPKIIASTLEKAADYQARQKLHPILNEMRNQYNDITREIPLPSLLKRTASRLIKKNDTRTGANSKRNRAIARINFFFDKSIKRKFDLLKYGVFPGLQDRDAYLNDTKRRSRIWHAIAAGKVFFGDSKFVYDKFTALIRDLEQREGNGQEIAKLKELRSELYSDIAFSALVSSIFGNVIWRALAYNIGSGITNRVEGYLAGMIEDSTGRYWTPGNFFTANRFVSSSGIHRLRNLGRAGKQQTIFRAMMQNYRIVMDASNEMQRNATKSAIKSPSWTHPFHFSVTSVELKNQGSNVLATMMDKTISGIDSNGNKVEVKVFDGHKFPAFEMKDGVLTLKPAFDTKENRADWIDGSSEGFSTFKNRTESMLVKLHGDFSEIGGIMAKKTDIGKAMLLFKTWLPMAVFVRLAREQVLIGDENKSYKGRWKSNTRLSAAVMGGIMGASLAGPFGALLGGVGSVVFAQKYGVRNDIEMGNFASIGLELVIHLNETLSSILRYSTFHVFNGSISKTLKYERMLKHEVDVGNMRSNVRETLFILSQMAALIAIRKLAFGEEGNEDDELEEEEEDYSYIDGNGVRVLPDPKELQKLKRAKLDMNRAKNARWIFLSNTVNMLMENSSQYLSKEYYANFVLKNSVFKWVKDTTEFFDSINDALVGEFTYSAGNYLGKNKLHTTFSNAYLPGPFRPTKGDVNEPYDATWVSRRIFRYRVDFDIVAFQKDHFVHSFLAGPQKAKLRAVKSEVKLLKGELNLLGYSSLEINAIIKQIKGGYIGTENLPPNKRYTRSKTSKLWKAYEKKVYDHYNHQCFNCARNDQQVYMDIEHKAYDPTKKAYDYDLDDVQVICKHCVHDRDLESEMNNILDAKGFEDVDFGRYLSNEDRIKLYDKQNRKLREKRKDRLD